MGSVALIFQPAEEGAGGVSADRVRVEAGRGWHADRRGVPRKAGISDATFYNWRKKYAGLMPSEMKRVCGS